jgi:hypothetical protein
VKAFWFHYNKPESRKAGHPVMTLHYEGKCHYVRSIVCDVPTKTRERNSQPHVVVVGKGVVEFIGNEAHIRESV